MYRQASFYAANWPEGTTIGEDGDVYAFYLPANEGADVKPVLVGSEYVDVVRRRVPRSPRS